MTIDKLKAGAREFYIQNMFITQGTKVVSMFNVQDDDKGLEADNYNHGDKYWHTIDYSALERALKILEIYEEALKDIKSSDTHGLKNAITYSNVAHEALEAARKVLDDKTN